MDSVSTRFLRDLHNLTKEELATIQKFESDPTGAGFVPIAEMLRNRGYIEEAIVILEDGCLRYPQYASARALLAQDYFTQGMFEESLRAAEQVLKANPDNALAQRIHLKLLILFDRREGVLSRLKVIAQAAPDDSLTSAVRKAVGAGDWKAAQKWVRAEIERNGISVDLDEGASGEARPQFPSPAVTDEKGDSSASRSPEDPPSWALPRQPEFSTAAEPESLRIKNEDRRAGAQAARGQSVDTLQETIHRPEALLSGSTLGHVSGDVDRYLLLRGFRPLDVGGYFVSHRERELRFGGVERATLADIYRAQGMHLKALEIYEGLIKQEPENVEYQAAYQSLKKEIQRQYFASDETDENEAKEVSDSKTHLNLERGFSAESAVSGSGGRSRPIQQEETRKKIDLLKQILGRLNDSSPECRAGTEAKDE